MLAETGTVTEKEHRGEIDLLLMILADFQKEKENVTLKGIISFMFEKDIDVFRIF